MLEQTKQQMAALRLNGMLVALDEQLLNPPHQLSFEERLSLLIDREHMHRENQRLSNRIKQAKLKSGYTMANIDYQHPRNLDKSRFLSLGNGEWVRNNRVFIFTGPSGTGKTFLAQALAHKACLQGFTARYTRLLTLMHECVIASREGKLQRYLKNSARINVLIIDDFGMMVMTDEDKRLLLEIIEYRYEQGSTIITSQLPLAEWYEHINDPIIADAILDRIVHQAEKFTLTGESVRKVKNKTVDT